MLANDPSTRRGGGILRTCPSRREKPADATTSSYCVERLRVDFGERVLDDGVVGAPDDAHQEQERVDPADMEWLQRRSRCSGQKNDHASIRGYNRLVYPACPRGRGRTAADRFLRVLPRFSAAWFRVLPRFSAALAAERLEEEQQERDEQHVDDERLDQHEAQNQRASHIARPRQDCAQSLRPLR